MAKKSAFPFLDVVARSTLRVIGYIPNKLSQVGKDIAEDLSAINKAPRRKGWKKGRRRHK